MQRLPTSQRPCWSYLVLKTSSIFSCRLRGLLQTQRICRFSVKNRMTDVLLSPDPNTTSSVFQNNSSNHSTPNSSKKRLNWLSWMRKSLHIGSGNRNNQQNSHHSQHRNSNKLCACGLHHVLDQNQDAETKSADYSSADDWPVFTTQMSQSGKSRLFIIFVFFFNN